MNVSEPMPTHPRWPTTPSNSPTHANDVNASTTDVIIDYLSQFDLPSDLESNQVKIVKTGFHCRRRSSKISWHHDIQHNDIQHSDTQHSNTQHNDIQHSDTQHKDIQHSDTQHNTI
jgi:hypothetical protein